MTLDLAQVHAILVTPFSGDGSRVDHGLLAAHVQGLLDAGVRVVVSGGNTSEYHALSTLERRATLATTVTVAAGQAIVVAGVGASVADVGDEGRAARDAGADALMVHTPAHPFMTPGGWLRYHDDLAAAADIPLLPYVRSPAPGMDAIVELARRPYTVAMKFALPDLLAFATVQSAAPDATAWICGIAESWAPAFAAHGAVGFTSGLANVLPSVSLGLQRDLAAGNLAAARATWARLRPFERLRSLSADGANVAVIKEALRIIGMDPGPVRPPSGELPPPLRTEVRLALDRLRT